MRECPECGSTDRYDDDDRYALVRVSESSSISVSNKVDALVCRLTICRGCGHAALFTRPD